MKTLHYPALTAQPLTKNGMAFTAAEVRARHKALIAATKVLEQAMRSLGEAVEDSTLGDGDSYFEVQAMIGDHQAAREATQFIIHGKV
jgi:nitrogen fixation protein FixH